MTRYLIIDDESIAHDIIKGYCDILPSMELAGQCYDAIEAMEFLRGESVDLIFLDLNMPKLKGFDFLRALSSMPKVIVTTAYREHALESYELDVVDYLLKPFGFERFLRAINKAMNVNRPSAVVTSSDAGTRPRSVFLRSEKRYVQVDLSSIRYIEASGNYCKIFTSTDEISIREKISDLQDLLQYDDMIRVHKSFVVSRSHINSIEGNRIWIGEDIIPIGKTYRLNVNRLLG